MLGTLTLVGSNTLAASPIVWAPAAARTVAITPAQPQGNAYGVQLTPNASLSWPAKSAADVEDFSLDLTAWLAPGDVISRFSVAINDTALSLLSQTHSSTLASVWLAGGTPGANASIDLTVTAASGRVGRFTVTLPVEALTPAEQAGYSPPAPTLAPGTLLGRGPGGVGPAEPLIMGPSFSVADGIVDVDLIGSAGITQEQLSAAVAAQQAATAAAVAVEAARAQNEESSLQDQITLVAENSGAGVTPQQLASAVSVETSRAQGAESTNATAIAAETTRAQGVEATQQAEIAALQASGTGTGTGDGGVMLPPNAGLLATDGSGGALARTLGAHLTLVGSAVTVTRTGWPINFHPFVQYPPAAGLPQILAIVDVATGEAATYAANLAGSIIMCTVAPAATYVVTLTKNGAAVATITFAAGGLVGTVASAVFTTAPGDLLQWVGQTTPDVSIGGMRLGLYGTLLQ